MKMPAAIPIEMLAPCGLNCQACYAHVRRKKPCPGCRLEGADKPADCLNCRQKACAADHEVQWCVDCPEFPCKRMKYIDKRYRQVYGVGLIADLQRMKRVGIETYLRAEHTRWSCPACGGVINLHSRVCSECGIPAADL